jgi:hypothetical protein
VVPKNFIYRYLLDQILGTVTEIEKVDSPIGACMHVAR